jgi:hypothetical protein
MADQDDYVQNEEGFSAEIERLLQDVALAAEAKEFFNSTIGRYLLQQASEAEVSAFRGFIEVDPDDAKAIRKVQEDAKIPKLVFAWLQDAITKGNNALKQAEALREMENEN